MKKIKQDKYLIYALRDPRTDEVRYVGKSTIGMRRPNQHSKEWSLVSNTHKNNWIKSLQLINLNPVIDVLEVHETPDTLEESEIFHISYLRAIGCNLTNATEGGEGTMGRSCSELTKSLIQQKALARDYTNFIPPNKQVHIFDNGIEKRKCTKCETYKILPDFCVNSKNGNFRGFCKECDKLRKQKARAINPDRNRYVKLSPEEYKKSRIEAARKGGQAIANSPEKRAAISAKRSKPVIAISTTTSEVLEFPSALKAKESGFHNKLIHDSIMSNKPYKNYYWKFKV